MTTLKIEDYRNLSRKIESAHAASEAAENLIVAALAVDGRFISGGFEDASPADREILKQLSRAVRDYLTT